MDGSEHGHAERPTARVHSGHTHSGATPDGQHLHETAEHIHDGIHHQLHGGHEHPVGAKGPGGKHAHPEMQGQPDGEHLHEAKPD